MVHSPTYTKETLLNVVSEVRNGRTTLAEASRTHSIPLGTLHKYVKMGVEAAAIVKAPGRQPVLSEMDEDILVQVLNHLVENGKFQWMDMINEKLVQTVLDKSGATRRFEDNISEVARIHQWIMDNNG